MSTRESNDLDSMFSASKLKQDRLALLLPWLVLAFTLIATYQLWQFERHESERAQQAEFDSIAHEINSNIEQRMAVYEQALRGVSGLFAASKSVERDEFRAYVAGMQLQERYPGIQGVSFSLIVPKAAKDKHIAAIRKEGFPGYTISPEGEREIYTTAFYLEPFSGRNLRAFGFDNYTDPVRRAAMEQARDSGEAALSGRVTLLHEDDKDKQQVGFRMYLPIYANNTPHDTVAERRANIIGWVYAPFIMDDLIENILGMHAGEVDVEIFDGDEISDKTLMYDEDRFPRTFIETLEGQVQTVNRLNIASYTWTTIIHSKPGFHGPVTERLRPIAFGGVTMSLLLTLLTWMLVHGRALALRAARQMNRELIEREISLRLAATVFNTVDEAVMVTGPDNRIIAVNPSFTRITGYAPDEVMDKDPQILSSGKHPPEFFKQMWETLTAAGAWKGEIWNRRKSGEAYIGWFSFNRVYDEKGKLANHVAVFSDITKRKVEEERIYRLAHYDLLTDLPNRALLIGRLGQAIAKAQRDKAHLALMFIDLDKFKPVNDAFGHEVGDLLLKEVAKRLQYCVRGSDTASRMGGDEFVVLLLTVEKESDAMMVAEKIRHELNQPFELAGHSLHISSSIGVAIYPEHGSDEEQLLKNADTAMYHSKKSGRNNVKLYQPGVHGNSE